MNAKRLINKAIKQLSNNGVRKPYYIQISIYNKKMGKYLDNLGCKKEINGTNVIYDVDKVLVGI